MKKIMKLLMAMLFIASAAMYGQTVTGTVLDETNQPLPGADVVLAGTTTGTSTDFDGAFTLDVNVETGTIEVSFIGYNTMSFAFTGTTDLGEIKMAVSDESLDEIVVVGIADIVKDRQTPVAVSTIKAAEIQDRLGSQELPEILNSTPSVYATKSGGGFGDSRINIRGFDQRNTAVLINGVPVNDMENGWVYWSNWAGLADVTSAMQVQRGLGSSKLAVSSVGGTINVLTRSASSKQGGTFATSVGNDGYVKLLGSYNTGMLDNGFSMSVLLSQTQGNGYNDGTEFLGNNYYIGIGYRANDKHDFQFTYTGAPQWHNQHSRSVEIYNYQRYGSDEYPNRKYNAQWGYKDGEVYTFRRNFYHKPVMSLNWDFTLSDVSKISTVAYASWGRGGGSGPIGSVGGIRDFDSRLKDENGLIRFDDIQTWNSGGSGHGFLNRDGTPLPDRTGSLINDRRNGMTRRASMNSHNWYGMISNFNHQFSDQLTFDFGVDLRTYKGIHYRVVNDDMGSNGYFDNRDQNNPDRMINEYYGVSPNWNPFVNIEDQQKIEYYNDGLVGWLGAFTQLEYKTETISTFIQAGISQQGFERVEYFNETPGNQKSGVEKIVGGNIKGGINYKVNEENNVFFNTGYYSKQPLFDAVWINFSNTLNDDLQNEKVFGLELGYGYHTGDFNAKVNLYRTSWKDRFESVGVQADDGTRGTANLYGIEQVHTGIEFEGNYRVSDKLSFQGMLSVGNWEYKGDVTARAFDEDQDPIPGEDVTLYLDGVKVGDAAQMTARIAGTYRIMDGLSFDASWYYANNLYAAIDPTDFDTPDHGGSLELPSYDLVDLGFSYKIPFNDDKQSIAFRLNVNNVFDEVYISEADTNRLTQDRPTQDTFKGVRTDNRVYWGFGRTWNFTMRYNF